MSLPESMLLDMYKKMWEIRLFEEKVTEIYTHGFMPGLAHLCIGQEAVAVGVCFALKPDDCLTSHHRGHGHLIARGGDLYLMMAEIMGKRTGYCRGKGGSMHIADFALGFLGATGIVGGGIPIAVGAGLALKRENKRRVSLSFFGDGASNQGSFHEAANLASVWKLPVVFICENNLYGISVSQERHQAIKDIYLRAKGYGMPGEKADGNDVLSVYMATEKALDRARQNNGPTLIEFKTYRFDGHHVGDPGKGILYRSDKEMKKWKKRCPIKRFSEHLVELGLLSTGKTEEIKQEIAENINKAVEKAKADPYPLPEELLQDLYA